MRYAWIAAGGAAGSVARWGVGVSMTGFAPYGFPVPTLLVNAAGAFALGWAYGRWFEKYGLSAVYQSVATGFLGAFTTMSAFGLEAWTLLSADRLAAAAAYIAVSAAAGPLLASLGIRVGEAAS